MIENNFKNLLGKKIRVSGIEKYGNIHIGYSEEENKAVYLFSEKNDDISIIAVIYDPDGKTIKLSGAESGRAIFEPYIKAEIGTDLNYEYFCLYEKTCGSIVYTLKEQVKYYLLIENDSGHIGFPKGHVEYGETEEETAVREVYEETGLKISINSDTRQEYTYTNSAGVIKNCVYFYNKFDGENIRIQQEEISRSWLLPFDKAYELLNYPQDKMILKKADLMYD